MLHRVAVLLLVIGCGDNGGDGTPPPTEFGGDRLVTLKVPEPLVPGRHYPLLLILHGYGASGLVQTAYFGLDDVASRGEAFVLAPDGLVDSTGHQFWNADAVCCDLDHKNPDDVGYLSGVVEEVMAAWPVDPDKVRVVGHSNGGFMAYRLACDRADLFTSIIALAGDASSGVTCAPAGPIHTLHIHGTADTTVPFSGAQPSIDTWATHNGCATTHTAGPTFDLDGAVPGAETSSTITDGCPPSGAVELWTMTGSDHIPTFSNSFDTAISQWFGDHPRQ
jgi:polyhydroxybutyrate depolymerase